MKLLSSSSCLLFLLSFLAFSSFPAISASATRKIADSRKFILEAGNLAPWATGFLQFTPASVPAYAPDAKFPLVLAAKQTDRPDILRRFKHYRGGWDITNRHYWTSVGFTGAAGFILASLWFVSFGFILAVHRCCRWGISLKTKDRNSRRISLALLLVFTCAAAIGCILLSVGQNEFHGEMMDTMSFVVNQSDFTVQILRNVTGYLSLAKTINVDQVFLPSDVKDEIDKLTVDLNDAATTLKEKTSENSAKIRKALNTVRYALIVVAAVMLVLALLGLLLSVLGHQHAIYIFIFSGWLLVVITFILCGVFVILNNAISDTCTAMKEWVEYPQAETALSNILPCVDERTSNQTLYQSKEVILQLVNVVNTAVDTIANSNLPMQSSPYGYNQSGPLMPSLCCPFDSRLDNQQCKPQEVSLANASMVWENYTCTVSASGICTSPGRVTPEIYSQLMAAVNVTYALYHYAPLLLSLQDCNFVRDTFTTITTLYCSHLEHYLKMVNAGLALISVGVMLCLVLWIVYANRPRREEVFVKLPAAKVAVGSNTSTGNEVESC
ncbi:uncharacterized protein LOC131237700 [Magnolia sinica]|uniref:uncharacterized protein LOC131237700 n=1 Tax=Magnolia sinica TaxID=86752 RepID=UPI002659B390|nr:uncharacterized protein LOC131237700 [Magnolia sinica]